MFFKGSRYEYVKEYTPTDSRGKQKKVKAIRFIHKPVTSAFSYTIKGRDRLDLLADTYYGDPTKFWFICDANDAVFPYELLVPANKIVIPQEEL